MPFNTVSDNNALGAIVNYTTGLTNLAAYASLHTAYSATGTNELTGGSPAYARVALSWTTPASGGSLSLASTPTAFNVPASQTVAFVGLWAVSSGGTASTQFAGMGANGGATMFAFTSTRHTDTPADTVTAPGSSYSAGQAVVMWSGVGASLPSGVTLGTIYYIISPSGASFQVSATSGGSAVNLGASLGSGLIQAITLESFGAQGTFQLSADTLSIT